MWRYPRLRQGHWIETDVGLRWLANRGTNAAAADADDDEVHDHVVPSVHLQYKYNPDTMSKLMLVHWSKQ